MDTVYSMRGEDGFVRVSSDKSALPGSDEDLRVQESRELLRQEVSGKALPIVGWKSKVQRRLVIFENMDGSTALKKPEICLSLNPPEEIDTVEEVLKSDEVVRYRDVKARDERIVEILDEIRYECEESDVLDMLHQLRKKIDQSSINVRGSSKGRRREVIEEEKEASDESGGKKITDVKSYSEILEESQQDLPTAAIAQYVDRPDPAVKSTASLELSPKEILYDIEEPAELVRRKDVPEKWNCRLCGSVFYWDRNHEEERATCPDCASGKTKMVESE